MTTLWTIARHELRVLSRERTLWAAVLVLAVCAAYGVANGHARTEAVARVVAEAGQEEAETFGAFARQATPTDELEVGSSGFDPAINPGILALFYPRPAALPPSPLAALSVGQSDVYPATFNVTAERLDSFLDEPVLANPTLLLSGPFDVAFVVVVVLPLLLILLSYDLVAGERERGTLRPLLAQSLSLRALVLGKLAARVVLPGVLVGVVLVGLVVTGSLRSSGAWTRFSLWVAVVLAYSACWLALVALVNAWGRHALTNALALAGLWMLVVLVVPALLHLAASTAAPVPSRTDLIIASREASTDARRPVELLQAYYAEHPDRYPTHPDFDIETYDFPLRWMAIQREVDRQMAPVLDRYDRALDRQRALANALRFLSPAALAQDALNDLSGSGLPRHQRFLAQVRDYHRAHKAFFEPLIFSKQNLVTADYDRMPRFAFAEEPTQDVVARVGIAFAGLLLITALATGVAGAKYRTPERLL